MLLLLFIYILFPQGLTLNLSSLLHVTTKRALLLGLLIGGGIGLLLLYLTWHPIGAEVLNKHSKDQSKLLMDHSLVSKAKSAFHNVAVKAERVFIDIKADLKAELSTGLDGRGESLPWTAKAENEKCYEDSWRLRILEISKKPEEFLLNGGIEKDVHYSSKSARAVLEHDENLRVVRFQYVPRLMKEADFWKRYFAAVRNVKREVMEASTPEPSTYSEKSVSVVSLISDCSQSQSPQKDPIEEAAYKKVFTAAALPSPKAVRRLASFIVVGGNFQSMRDLADGNFDNANNDWSTFSLAAVRILSLREKDGSLKGRTSNHGGKHRHLIRSLLDADAEWKEKHLTAKEVGFEIKSKVPDEIHGAPLIGFVTHLAEIMSSIKTGRQMAEFWSELIKELRCLWRDGVPIPHVPVDNVPDLRYCLLHQQLQVVNCCIARRKKRSAALFSLDKLQETATTFPIQGTGRTDRSVGLYAICKDANPVLRLGADHPSGNLKMLETQEPVYSPITQEGPVLTEDLIKETEELVLRTKSVGAGCSQLFSDMQAFKAANPGCILEDFVRWYSPPDWKEGSVLAVDGSDGGPSSHGHLSARMKLQGNLWQELWFSARPIPAVKQAPLFDEDLAGESTLSALEDIKPADLFEQLFISTLGVGLACVDTFCTEKNGPLTRTLRECIDYVTSTCKRHMDSETIDSLCEVYEFMESMVHAPPEAPDYGMDFVELNDSIDSKSCTDDQPKARERPNVLIRFFESKASLFEWRPKHEEERKVPTAEGEWTII